MFLNLDICLLQARVRGITEIVAELQRGVKEGRDVNLNAIKRDVCCCRFPKSPCNLLKLKDAGTELNHHSNLSLQASSKYCLAKAPKLVEIMNAVPEEFKSILIPQ